MTNIIAIIGGGPNLAMETSRRFGREGWRVVLGARNAERMADQVRVLRSEAIMADSLVVDATDHRAVRSFTEEVELRHGPIVVFNYNAAVIRNAGILDQPADAVASDLMTNVGGALFALQAMLPAMAGRKAGTIILSGGGLAIDPWPDYLTLSIGKAGLRALGQAVAKDPASADVHIAHAILHAQITPDNARKIAELYWILAHEDRDHWRHEVTFSEQDH